MFSQKFQKISLLPGTKEEINSIAETLQKQHFQLFVMTGENAKEEALKETVNPTVLHVATHGFFDSKNYKSNPMTRSGLLLTGVSSLAREGYSPQKDDGVLTAQEAANLELSKTELVVLSACETALGDVRAGEGVYGLQRAFKVAGAKNLIMSLWKVDDAVTQFLMTNFYRFYVENGNVREAFYQARKIVKEKYPAPYFWAAFVLAGE
jgi:CHAT domain-containing protein